MFRNTRPSFIHVFTCKPLNYAWATTLPSHYTFPIKSAPHVLHLFPVLCLADLLPTVLCPTVKEFFPCLAALSPYWAYPNAPRLMVGTVSLCPRRPRRGAGEGRGCPTRYSPATLACFPDELVPRAKLKTPPQLLYHGFSSVYSHTQNALQGLWNYLVQVTQKQCLKL